MVKETELKDALKEKKLIIGAQAVLKALKQKKTKKVYLASNCPEKISSEIEHYAKLAGASVVKVNRPNDELGVFCKKPFSISVLAIK